MEKEFVPYELAIRMKALGYAEPYFGWYDQFRLKKEYHPLKDSGSQEYMRIEDCTAPTFSQAFRWFRKKFGMCGYVSPLEDASAFYYMIYTDINKPYSNRICSLSEKWGKHEEAELACLTKLIEIVETRTK